MPLFPPIAGRHDEHPCRPAAGIRRARDVRHHIHQAVLDYGAKVSGCTVHFVDEQYDTGPIILQTPVPVEEDDTPETLAARVLARRTPDVPQAVALFAQGR